MLYLYILLLGTLTQLFTYRKRSGSSAPVRSASELWLHLGKHWKIFGLDCTLWWLFCLSWGWLFYFFGLVMSISTNIKNLNSISIYPQEEGYVLPLRWWGVPVRMSCPVMRKSLKNPPTVTCSSEGMVVKTEWASPVDKIQVNCMYLSMECFF